METLKNHEWMELSRANNVYNIEFGVETRLEHENKFFHRKHAFPVKITFCTLSSLLQRIQRF